jgi:ribosomal protein S18 acetylase RimI-like enzyme
MNQGGRCHFSGNSGIGPDGLEIGVDGSGRVVRLESLDDRDAIELGGTFAKLEPWRSYGSTAAGMAEFLSTREAGAQRFGICCDKRLAGAMCLRPNWLRGPYLQFLALLPEAQKQGIGACVLHWLEAEAAAAGGRHVWIMVADSNSGALRFYEHHGYEVSAAVPDVVKDGMTELLLRKRV